MCNIQRLSKNNRLESFESLVKASSPSLVLKPREERKLLEELSGLRLIMLILFLESPHTTLGLL
jgi:hypothetical protein